jgi:predicted ester cyclase
MIKTDLSSVYRDYIACLNKQDWPNLEKFVHDEVTYNGQQIGILGYREMLEGDFYEIPDLYLEIQLLISDAPYVASPAPLRLYANGNVPWPPGQREEGFFYRECIL